MKYTIIIFVLILSAMATNAQQYEVKTSSRSVFDVKSGTKTSEVLTVEDQDFPVYVPAKGAKYVIAVSIAGREYPVWVGTKNGDEIEGKPIYVTKNKKYCFYKLSKKGYPYPVYLTKTK